MSVTTAVTLRLTGAGVARGFSACSGPGFGIHSDIVMPYISHYGTPEQIERFIPAMTAGSKIAAIAMTEPGAGR